MLPAASVAVARVAHGGSVELRGRASPAAAASWAGVPVATGEPPQLVLA